MAKIASKNDPLTREKAKEVFFNGRKVKPILFIGTGRKYMAVAYEDGSLAYEHDGDILPIDWRFISHS